MNLGGERLAAHRLVVPEAVAGEVSALVPPDAAVRCLAASNSWERVSVAAIAESVVGWDMGRGESEVLSWCLRELPAVALLDDREARAAASALGVVVRGSLGIVVLARRHGLVPRARPLIDALLRAGLRLDARLVAEALRLAGEE